MKQAVFPAQAGVFPNIEKPVLKYVRSSPRKRGCFRKGLHCGPLRNVFPAQAGVFLFTSVYESM